MLLRSIKSMSRTPKCRKERDRIPPRTQTQQNSYPSPPPISDNKVLESTPTNDVPAYPAYDNRIALTGVSSLFCLIVIGMMEEWQGGKRDILHGLCIDGALKFLHVDEWERENRVQGTKCVG
jgi:hypothetical protein